MDREARRTRYDRWLRWIGFALLVYALLGNYLVLPGYLRFLAREEAVADSSGTSMALIWGATRTILWMLSFQLAILCLALAYARRHALHARPLFALLIVWLALWSWPTLPQPGAAFYVVFGSIILVAIALVFAQGDSVDATRVRRTFFVASLAFFAFATWEICGLGSAGRILHPAEASRPFAHNLLVTQSSKLMVELVLAWTFMALSMVPFSRTRV